MIKINIIFILFDKYFGTFNGIMGESSLKNANPLKFLKYPKYALITLNFYTKLCVFFFNFCKPKIQLDPKMIKAGPWEKQVFVNFGVCPHGGP